MLKVIVCGDLGSSATFAVWGPIRLQDTHVCKLSAAPCAHRLTSLGKAKAYKEDYKELSVSQHEQVSPL